MDPRLEPDNKHKLAELTERPSMDLHLRIEEHRVEGYIWSEGRRFRVLGVRDEEDLDETPSAAT